jgi:hypothetical protein
MAWLAIAGGARGLGYVTFGRPGAHHGWATTG